MNSRVRKATLRILMLLEEFSPEELAEAVSLIHGQERDLLAFLRRKSSSPKRVSPPNARKAMFSTKGETRALQELKRTDGEKYQILKDFETSIREGKLLRTMDEFRAFGTVLGQEIGKVKSVKDALGPLMAELASLDLNSIREAIAKVPTRQGEEEDAYRRLANQIISGRAHEPSDG